MTARRTEIGVAERAAQWIIDLEDESQPASLADFSAWLKASPRHVEEFLLATAAWRHFDNIDAQRRIDVQRLLTEVAGNVVPLDLPEAPNIENTEQSHFPPARSSHRQQLPRLALTVTAIGALACWAILVHFGRQTYTTTLGEQRSVKLADGSIIQLNAASRVEVKLTQHARDIRLLEGEALFTAARETSRPFRVQSGDATIQAIGTQFDVRRRASGTLVSVVEGVVKVSTAVKRQSILKPGIAMAGQAIDALRAGEQADIPLHGTIARHATENLADTLAWRERRLVFRDDSLEDIVTEFNRYNAGFQIRLEGNAGNAIRLTGVFRADDPEAVLLYLTANSELAVEKRADGAIIRARRP